MDELSATAEGDNGTPDPVATPEGTQPLTEGAPAGVAESDNQAETEEPYVSPFAGKAFEEIERDPEVARLLADRQAKADESNRQRTAAAERKAAEDATRKSYQDSLNRSATVLGGELSQRIRGIAKAVEEGRHVDAQGRDLTESWIAPIVQEAGRAAIFEAQRFQQDQFANFIGDAYPGVQYPQELVNQFHNAMASFDGPTIEKAKFALVTHAVRAAEEPEIRKRWEADAAKKAADEAELARQRQNQTARDSRARPTNASTANGQRQGPASSKGEAADMLADGRMTLADYKRQGWHLQRTG